MPDVRTTNELTCGSDANNPQDKFIKGERKNPKSKNKENQVSKFSIFVKILFSTIFYIKLKIKIVVK